MPAQPWTLALLTHPYARLQVIKPNVEEVRSKGRKPGSAVIWCMSGGRADGSCGPILRARPGGLPLLVVLPAAGPMSSTRLPFELNGLRPYGILPYHATPTPADLSQVLRRPPIDLGGDVADYLRWRGVKLDRDTVHLIRRIIDLSRELRSISAVCRSLYMSRRALGRRLMARGLPVPSHWLQVGRLLRVAIRLQNSDATVSSVAFEHGYPDGFSLSNQMERLIGHRPSEVRRCLGWEWLVESWLRSEAESGRFTASIVQPGRRSDGESVTWSRSSSATRTNEAKEQENSSA